MSEDFDEIGEFQKRLPMKIAAFAYPNTKIIIDAVMELFDELRNDLELPRSYMHRSHRHKGKVVDTTSFLDEDLEEFKQKLVRWLGTKKEELKI